MYRAYIGLEKYKLVLDELRNTQTEELKGLQLLAEYLHLRQGASIDENRRLVSRHMSYVLGYYMFQLHL